MLVRCLRSIPSDETADQYGIRFEAASINYHISVGDEYIPLGVYFRNGNVWLEIADDNYIFEVPLDMFEIIEGSLSSYWRITTLANGDVSIRPPEFNAEYFYDDLLEDKGSASEIFHHTRIKIEIEARQK